MKKILKIISDIIYPVKCICCGNIENNKIFCSRCLERLNNEAIVKCEICKKPSNLCNCRKILYIDEIFYKYLYRGNEIRKAIYAYKRDNLYYINEFFAKELFTLIEKSDRINISDIDYITNVPRKVKSIKYFGYDQTRNLAKLISKYSGIPYIPILRLAGNTKEQKKLNYNERIANVKNKYVPSKKINNSESECNVLLIDDIVATGATISECARVLKNTGANKIYGLCIAAVSAPKLSELIKK